ncbi:unnamed protein product [Euphydryas editha]|uniref:Uncharacterized protein n=1 Tax=Euphydryas editha TaxID=104508 RepID=A0AAU9UKC6_EUPED|nr:unnamed protein product [Euphydryas editha]
MNSPTSSSESDYEYLFNNNFRANSFWTPPFYPTFGQPLIYYAEVKPKRRSRRNQENEKNKSNCFVKAFRWYTQEHVPFKKNQSSNNIDSEDMKGFATWLDEKYNEYLQTNQIEQNQCTLTQASTLQVVNTAQISNSSVTSDTKALNMKLKHISKSLTSVLKDKEIYVIPFDALKDTDHKDLKNNDNKSKRKERKKLKQIFPKKESLESVKSQHTDVFCRCSHKNFEKIDSSNKFQKNLTNICQCEKKAEFEVQQKTAVLSESRTNTKHHKSTTSVTMLVSDSVQTSDYSINLANETFHNHPLFVKIIHADKLKYQRI